MSPAELFIPNPEQIEKGIFSQPKTEEPTAAAQTEEQPEEPAPNEPVITPPHEYTDQQKDEVAADDAQRGAVIPRSTLRPSAPKPTKEEGSVIVARELAGQLGTSPELKAQMRIDERKFAVLKDAEVAAIAHFSYRHVFDGIRYFGHIVEWQLTGSQGVGGLGRRHALQAIAASTGAQAIEKAKKPNAVARNLWDRNWKEKAEAEGKVPEE